MGKGAKLGVGVTGVPVLRRKTKFACPSERNPVFSLHLKICFALIHSSIIAITIDTTIILVYRGEAVVLVFTHKTFCSPQRFTT